MEKFQSPLASDVETKLPERERRRHVCRLQKTSETRPDDWKSARGRLRANAHVFLSFTSERLCLGSGEL